MKPDFAPLPSETPGRRLSRLLGIGRLVYWSWWRPKAALARSRREGGPWQQWLDRRARRAMIAAARELPACAAPAAGAPAVHFLTGRRCWYQTAFCAWSLQHVAGIPLRFAFGDDGTIDSGLAAEISRLFPDSTVISAAEAVAQLDIALPARRFPTLRNQRLTYVHLRKLTDFHAGRRGWHLVLDSDMLFFRRPDALLTWLAGPERPVHMLDTQDAYGYPSATLDEIAGRPLPRRVNVGILGLQSHTLDWDRIESWATQLLARHGTSYYLEQALCAMLLADTNALRLSETEYRMMPSLDECRRPVSTAHHYADLSKRGYFRHAWRNVFSTGAAQ